MGCRLGEPAAAAAGRTARRRRRVDRTALRLGELRLLRLAVLPAAAAVLTVLLGGELRLLRLAVLPAAAAVLTVLLGGELRLLRLAVLPAAAAVLTVLLRRLEAAAAVLPVLLLLRTHTRTRMMITQHTHSDGPIGGDCAGGKNCKGGGKVWFTGLEMSRLAAIAAAR